MFLVSEVDLLAFVQGRASEASASQDFKLDLDAYACLIQTSE